MSYVVIWGYKTGLMNKKFVGIAPCECCHRFSEQYLAKSFFRINLFWFIPIFGVPTGKYLRCGKCDGVMKLTREQWKELKEKARYMPKKKQYMQAYEELKAVVLTATPDELDTPTIYNRLLGRIDFTDDGGHIRELVETYLQNSQNVANMLGKTEETPAVEAAGETAAITNGTPETKSTDAPVSKAAEAQPAANTNAPHLVYKTAEESEPKKRSKLRLLWLIPAILLLLPALIMAFAGITVAFEDPSDIGFTIISLLLFTVAPIALEVLFFSLAFKKKR